MSSLRIGFAARYPFLEFEFREDILGTIFKKRGKFKDLNSVTNRDAPDGDIKDSLDLSRGGFPFFSFLNNLILPITPSQFLDVFGFHSRLVVSFFRIQGIVKRVIFLDMTFNLTGLWLSW